MMKSRTTLVALLLSLALPAAAELRTLVNAVETVTSNINVPTSPSGRLSFRACDSDCDAEFTIVRLTPQTKYVVRGETLDFLGFRKEFFNMRRGEDALAVVTYDTEKNVVTSLLIAKSRSE